MPFPSHRTPARWPFWLLLVAWFCANSPPVVTYTVLSWVGEARHFSHQKHLVQEVAHLLAGEKAPSHIETETAEGSARPAPALPGEVALKKIVLALEDAAAAAPPPVSAGQFGNISFDRQGALRAAPPHGPPRTIAVG